MVKINNMGPTGFNPYKQNANMLDEAKKTSVRGKDKIEISTTAKELQQTSPMITQREAKVEEIKVSIENGTYSLNAKETAKSILNFYKKL